MRVLFMGQTGIDKKRHLELLRNLSSARGKSMANMTDAVPTP